MTWSQVARKDFEAAVRSKMLWGVMDVFVAFLSFVALVTVGTSDGSGSPGGSFLQLTLQLGQLFVPIVALIAGYLAVVGERQSGSLRILLGYPHSRRDVVIGKLLGRSIVIAVTLVVGSTVSILLSTMVVSTPTQSAAIGAVAVIALFGISFTGLAVGISAAADSRGKAMALAIGSLLVFLLVWDAAVAGTYAVVTGSLPGLEVESWYFLLQRLSPLGAFRTLASAVVDGQVSPMVQMGLENIPQGTSPEQLSVSNRIGGELPFYLSDWFAGVTLAVWGLLPSVIGTALFERSDL